jgi:hypothetical protein
MTNYQKRERDDPRCSSPKCRQTYEVRYLAGASPINPNMDVQLCDKHDHEYCLRRQVLFNLHTEKPGDLPWPNNEEN